MLVTVFAGVTLIASPKRFLGLGSMSKRGRESQLADPNWLSKCPIENKNVHTNAPRALL